MTQSLNTIIFFIWIGMNQANILIERGVELTNLYKEKSNNNFYSVLNGNNNPIIRKRYSSFRSPGIENIKYTLITVPNKEYTIFTDLQVLQIQNHLANANNKIGAIVTNGETASDFMSSNEGSNWEGYYIILDDSNPFATGGRLTEGNGNQIGVVNLNINDIYEQSIKNREGTISFTLANDPNGRQINTIDNSSSNNTLTSPIPPLPSNTSIKPTTPLPSSNSNNMPFTPSSPKNSNSLYLQYSIISLILYLMIF